MSKICFKSCLYNQENSPANIYLYKASNWNTTKSCEIFSKLTTKALKRRQWCRSGVFIVKFEIFRTFIQYFHCWIWACICFMEGATRQRQKLKQTIADPCTFENMLVRELETAIWEHHRLVSCNLHLPKVLCETTYHSIMFQLTENYYVRKVLFKVYKKSLRAKFTDILYQLQIIFPAHPLIFFQIEI